MQRCAAVIIKTDFAPIPSICTTDVTTAYTAILRAIEQLSSFSSQLFRHLKSFAFLESDWMHSRPTDCTRTHSVCWHFWVRIGGEFCSQKVQWVYSMSKY